MNESGHGAWSIFRRLLLQARPYWPLLGTTFALELLATPIALLTPLPLMMAVDSVLGNKALPWFLAELTPDFIERSKGALLLLVASMVLLIALLNQAQALGCWMLRSYTGERLVLNFRAFLLAHAQRLSFAYHDTKGTTDSAYRIQYDAPAIEWVVINGIAPFVTAALTLVSMVTITARIDLKLALVALSVAPVIAVLIHAFRGRLRRQWDDAKQVEAGALSVIQEILTALRIVRAFGQEEREQDRFVQASTAGVQARLRVIRSEAIFGLSMALTIACGTTAVLYIGVAQVQSGALTLGQLLLVMAYLVQLYQPLQTVGNQFAMLQGSLSSAERAFALLDAAPDVVERHDALPLKRARGDIELRDVSFSYDGRRPALKNVSARIPAGAVVGIAGRTGAGKTTLVNLLMRFFDPDTGSVLLDGRNIRDYRLRDLRDQFAVLPQETMLFSTTLAENIAYAKPQAPFEEIVSAAKAANIHEFITSLPDGYETKVGERGMALSGGQRQRIALARAFLKNAPIIVLDEPTSAVDTMTENLIIEALEKLSRGRTVVMIAHRVSTLRVCDHHIKLDEGELVAAVDYRTHPSNAAADRQIAQR